MARTSVVVVTTLLVLMVVSSSSGSPWFDFLRPRYPQRRRPNPVNSQNGKERYKQICRTINADNFAFPGRVPFPAGPVCPY